MNEENEMAIDHEAIAKFVRWDVMLEKIVCVIAHLSRKKKTPAVEQAIRELAQMRMDILNSADIGGLNYDDAMERIYAYADVK